MFLTRSLVGLFVLTFLLAASASSSAAISPQLVSSADYYLYEKQSVSVTNGELVNLSINYSIPIDSKPITFPPGSRFQTDADQNPYFNIFASNPSLPYAYEVNTTVHTQATSIGDLPARWDAPAGSGPSLASTAKVPSDDPAIKKLAQSITENATTSFEQVAVLASWVNRYLTYDASMVGQVPGANDILRLRRGVCTEYTTLFTTLARSLGYPTRFVNGYAYSDRYNAWLGHAWAEVYIGRWVPVDSTWLEVGYLDATHIVSSRRSVQDFRSASISALVSPADAKLVWTGGESRGTLANNVHLVGYTQDTPSHDYTLASSSTRLGPDGKFLAYLALPAKDYRLMQVQLTNCQSSSGSQVLDLQGGEQRLATAPGQTFYLIWRGQASSDLRSSARYTCPLSLNSPTLALDTLTINITTADELDWPAIAGTLSNTQLPAGQTQVVSVSLPSNMAGTPITLLEQDRKMVQAAAADGSARFTYSPSRHGPHTVYVFAPSGDPVELNYTVGEASGVSFSDIHLLGLPAIGSSITVQMNWALTQGVNTSGWRLEWSWNGQSGSMPLPPFGGPFNLTFRPTSPGDHDLILRAVSANGDEMVRQTYPLVVPAQADVSLDHVEVQPIDRTQAQVQLWVKIQGQVNNLELRIDNRVMEVPTDGSLTFTLPSGNYSAELTWMDSNGTLHRTPVTIDAAISPSSANPPPSLIPSGLPPAALQIPKQSFCPSGLVLVLLPPAAMLAARKKKGEPADEKNDEPSDDED